MQNPDNKRNQELKKNGSLGESSHFEKHAGTWKNSGHFENLDTWKNQALGKTGHF